MKRTTARLLVVLLLAGCQGPMAGPLIAPPTRLRKGTEAAAETRPSTTTPGRKDDAVAWLIEELAGHDAEPRPSAEERPVRPSIIGEEGLGGDISPRAAAALRGRLRPPVAIDIDGDGTPEIEVTRQDGKESGYRVLYRQPGEKAASMVWFYSETGRLERFKRDIDRDGLPEEILVSHENGDILRVYRSKSGEVFVVRSSGGDIDARYWAGVAGRPLAGELVSTVLDDKNPTEAVKGAARAEALWRNGTPWRFIRREGEMIVEAIAPLGLDAGAGVSVIPTNALTRKLTTGKWQHPTSPPSKADVRTNASESHKTAPPSHGKNRSRGGLFSGVVFAGSAPRRYSLYKLAEPQTPEVLGVPGEIMAAWKRSLSEIFVLDLSGGDGWKARLVAIDDGRTTWERRDRDGDGTYETKVLRQSKLETVTERSDGKKIIREVYYGGELMKTMEDIDGDGRFDMMVYYWEGKAERVEMDTDGDGRVDRWEFLQDGRVLEDTDGDGLPDRWKTRKGDAKGG